MINTSTLADGAVVLGGVICIGGLVYWVIKARLKDDFCSKKECDARHKGLDGDLEEFKENTTNTLKEIKDSVLRVEGRLFDILTSAKRRK